MRTGHAVGIYQVRRSSEPGTHREDAFAGGRWDPYGERMQRHLYFGTWRENAPCFPSGGILQLQETQPRSTGIRFDDGKEL